MVTMVGHGDGLSEALGFIVDRARTDRVDVTPIALFLWMFLRITIDFGSRG